MTSQNEPGALRLANWVLNMAAKGVLPLSGAEALAMEYKINQDYKDDDARVDSLIKWETAKNFTTGFMTGLGGMLTLPVSIPGGLGASYLIQARMIAAIASIYGHDISDAKVRTLILVSMLGDAGKEVLKDAGVKAGSRLAEKIAGKISSAALLEINRKVGFRLLATGGAKGVVNLTKLAPLSSAAP